ncbi:MAG: heavy-metal-associated domain-containing protein [Clostridiaceae bacterium]|nr:heavy-metal-associated domain-containing protein [Clostridiaceae bacterium]
MKKAEFKLDTLTCPTCVKKIENSLNKTKGINSVRVLFNSSKVKVEFDENETNADKIGGVLLSLGFTVLSTKIT